MVEFLKFIYLIKLAATQIHRVLTQWIYRIPKLQSVTKTAHNLHGRKNVDSSAPPSANYDILVSVFHPRPDQQKVNWDVRTAIDSELLNFFVLRNQLD